MWKRLSAVILLSVGVGLADDRDFLLPLKVEHAQVQDLFVGCRAGATDGYDRAVDDMAPPPGMDTGYVGLINRAVKNSLLYKDIKAHGDVKEWEILLQVHEEKPMKISWTAEHLPAAYDLTFLTNEAERNMREVFELVFSASQTVTIVAGLRPEALPETEAVPEKPPVPPADAPAKPAPPATVAQKPAADPSVPADPPVSPQRVAGGVTMLVLLMGGLLLLVAIFAAVRR